MLMPIELFSRFACPPWLATLHLITTENNLFLVRRLIQRTDMRNPDPAPSRFTSLAWAAVLACEEVFEFLLENDHDEEELSRVSIILSPIYLHLLLVIHSLIFDLLTGLREQHDSHIALWRTDSARSPGSASHALPSAGAFAHGPDLPCTLCIPPRLAQHPGYDSASPSSTQGERSLCQGTFVGHVSVARESCLWGW